MCVEVGGEGESVGEWSGGSGGEREWENECGKVEVGKCGSVVVW